MTPFQALRRHWRRLKGFLIHENWMIGVVAQPIENSVHWTRCPDVAWIGPRASHRYLADPFALPGSRQTLYCEAFDLQNLRGHLLQLALDGHHIVAEERVDLPLPGHLSFPFLFAYQGQIHLMPESSQSRRLVIFRQQASGEWGILVEVAQDIAAVDPVFFEHDGFFWIAYTDGDLGPCDNLNLRFAERLEGPWLCHPGNPVKRGVFASRNAGPLFRAKDALYRPAQDCSTGYGEAIRIMRVLRCSRTVYSEAEVTRIMPEQGRNPHGLHTIAPFGPDHCLIDGKRRMFLAAELRRKIARRHCR